MRILYICHYAGSPHYGMAFRPYYMAREWVKAGHEVTIVAADQSHLRKVNPTVAHDFEEEMIDGVRYVWLKTTAYEGNSSMKRVRNILDYVCKLVWHRKRVARTYRPDLVVASSTYPLDNYPAHLIARLAGAKHCYEAHDIWPLSPMEIGGYSKYHPYIMLMQWAENYSCRKSDKVISLLYNSEVHYRECGLPEGHFACIPNGYDPEEWTEERFSLPLPSEHQQAFDEWKGKIVVGVAGGFAASGALMTLLQAALLLKDDDRLRFMLVGKGPEREKYVSFIEEHGLQNVKILPPVDKVCIPALEQRFDIAFMGGVHSKLHFYGTSINKVTDYMLSGLPIVSSHDEPGNVVERTKCGIRVGAEDYRATADAITSIANLTPEERKQMGLRGRSYVVENLPWATLAARFIEEMK